MKKEIDEIIEKYDGKVLLSVWELAAQKFN